MLATRTMPDEPHDHDADSVARARHLLTQLQQALAESERHVGVVVGPAWKRATRGEPRWQPSLGVLAAVALQITLPASVVVHPRWLLPLLAVVLLAALVAANPVRIDRRSPALRAGSAAMIAVITLANAWSGGRLVADVVRGDAPDDAVRLLLTGASIWLTNVLAFALWYWELDRGGPAARAHGVHQHPDFAFTQMTSPELASPDWEPGFVDYLYLSFTNAAAFSPTDVLPLSRWAKLTMLVQASVSLTTVALVVARAVNTLR